MKKNLQFHLNVTSTEGNKSDHLLNLNLHKTHVVLHSKVFH